MPNIDQLLEIAPTTDLVVPGELLDENDHVNVGHYFEIGSHGMWQLVKDRLLMPATYIDDRGLSTFTVEHHLRYLAELRRGDRVTVHPLVVGATDKALHLAALMVDRTHERLSCVVEAVIVHVDMATRRTSAFPADVTAAIEHELVVTAAIDWEIPISGALGVRQ